MSRAWDCLFKEKLCMEWTETLTVIDSKHVYRSGSYLLMWCSTWCRCHDVSVPSLKLLLLILQLWSSRNFYDSTFWSLSKSKISSFWAGENKLTAKLGKQVYNKDLTGGRCVRGAIGSRAESWLDEEDKGAGQGWRSRSQWTGSILYSNTYC